MRKKLLLIGGTGFIGLHLAKKIPKSRYDITIFSKNLQNIRKIINPDKAIKLIRGDVTNYRQIEEIIKDKDIIINLAAVVNAGPDFNPYEDLEVNCKGQLNILEARKKINPTSRYIFIGTRTQFGIVGAEQLPIKEDFCQKPVSLYGIHKTTAERYCELYNRAFGLSSIVLRLPQVYGPSLTGDETHNAVEKLIKKAIADEQFSVYGYGQDYKDLIHIEDFADLIIAILDSDIEEGVYNVGSGEKIMFIDIAKKIVELCGSGSFKAEQFPESIVKFEIGSSLFDISKVKKDFKWAPKICIDEGLKETIEFYRRQLK